MAWTKIIGPEEAEGLLEAVYGQLKARGITAFPEFVGVYTQEPQILRWLVLDLAPGSGYGVTGIDRTLVELIAYTVSFVNRCENCMAVHAGQVRRLLEDDALADQVLTDYTTSPLDPTTRLVLDYAAKLTLRPAEVASEDLEGLREAGYSDQQIVGIAHVAAWFNYVNRIAHGLRTELRR